MFIITSQFTLILKRTQYWFCWTQICCCKWVRKKKKLFILKLSKQNIWKKTIYQLLEDSKEVNSFELVITVDVIFNLYVTFYVYYIPV